MLGFRPHQAALLIYSIAASSSAKLHLRSTPNSIKFFFFFFFFFKFSSQFTILKSVSIKERESRTHHTLCQPTKFVYGSGIDFSVNALSFGQKLIPFNSQLSY